MKFDRDVLTPERLQRRFISKWASMEIISRGSMSRNSGDVKRLKGLDISVEAVVPEIVVTLNAQGTLSDGFLSRSASSASWNGKADIGFIDSTGIDLGDVSIEGNLERIVAGDSKLGTAGLKSLTVDSLGALGDAADAGAYGMTSVVIGKLGKLDVKHDIVAAFVRILGGGRGASRRARRRRRGRRSVCA